MEAILYIARKQIKNNVVKLVRKPARLITLLLSVALIVWMMTDLPSVEGGHANLQILQSGYLIWLLVLGTITALSSLTSGSSLFHLPDVNLLFVSPLSPKTVLAYGMIRSTGKTFMSFAFLLFYSGMLIDSFGITAADVIALILGTALFLIVVQVFSLTLYCIANKGAAQRAAVKAGILAVPLLVALFVLSKMGRAISWQSFAAAAALPQLDYFPVIGWIRGMVFALIAGNGTTAAVYAALTAVSLVLAVVLLLRINADYYEDVLSNAEKTFEIGQAAKEKRPVKVRKHKKVGNTGLGHGWGASAFFFKHLRETGRGSRFSWISGSTFLLLVINLAIAGLISLIADNKSGAVPPELLMVIGCAFSIYVLFFQNASGDWSNELKKPYLYLVPEPPFQKLIWASLSTVLRPAVDGLVAFAVVCALLKANPYVAVACALAYASFGFLFTAGSVLGRRVLGTVPNRGVVMMLYMMLLFLVMAPGVAGSVVLMVALNDPLSGVSPFFMVIPMSLWNIMISFVIFYACKNILSSSEY